MGECEPAPSFNLTSGIAPRQLDQRQSTRQAIDELGGCGSKIDLAALCYYRYERIVVDIAACAERAKGLGISNQFLPNNVVDIAHRTYDQL
jgi:hypothetical protein